MDSLSNFKDYQESKAKLDWHIQRRNACKKMYRNKGVQMIDKPQLILSDIIEPKLKPQQSSIYQNMKTELTKKGFSGFRFLGQGAQGLVLLANNSQTKFRYAIKGVQVRDNQGNLDENLYKQVKQEVELLEKCKDSPYVVSLLDHFEGEQFSYLVLTECQGTLKEIVERNQNKRLNEISAIKYSKDIAEGLYYIHSKNCLVNDLKLDNILIDYNGNAVISDFGFADKMTNTNDYVMNQYMGNFLYQAPECYDPSETDIGKVYYDEYQKLGVTVKKEPSSRSEAFSLGYLIYTLLQGIDFQLAFQKHQPLKYDGEFQNMVYHQQLKQVIDGLTQFAPRKRWPIKNAIIILKGIISFEFQLDDFLIEMIDTNTQKLASSLSNEIEFVKDLSNQFYPIFKNEESFIQQLREDHQKYAYESKIAELQQANIQLQERVRKQEEITKTQKNELEQLQIQLQNESQKKIMISQNQNQISHNNQHNQHNYSNNQKKKPNSEHNQQKKPNSEHNQHYSNNQKKPNSEHNQQNYSNSEHNQHYSNNQKKPNSEHNQQKKPNSEHNQHYYNNNNPQHYYNNNNPNYPNQHYYNSDYPSDQF